MCSQSGGTRRTPVPAPTPLLLLLLLSARGQAYGVAVGGGTARVGSVGGVQSDRTVTITLSGVAAGIVLHNTTGFEVLLRPAVGPPDTDPNAVISSPV